MAREWKKRNVYKVENHSDKPKYYVLDMFPYPSGAGLHVGHPLGYIASDIVSRFKRLKGFNVLHPMGFDAFGLPAEQYAIDHGIHPADFNSSTTFKNFKDQLSKLDSVRLESRSSNLRSEILSDGHNGSSFKFSIAGSTEKKEKQNGSTDLITVFEKEGNKNHPFPEFKICCSFIR